MIALGGGVCERPSNIVRFKVGKIGEYFFFRSTAGEACENVFDADSHPAYARAAATLTRVQGDPI